MPSATKASTRPSQASSRPKGQTAAKIKDVTQRQPNRTAQGKAVAAPHALPAFAAASVRTIGSNVERGGPSSKPLAALDAQNTRRPGGGQPLPAHILSALQNTLGVDLSPVRLHTATAWQKRAQLLNARAFTFGRDIFLGPGERATDIELLSHEAAHVVQQQSKTRIQAKSAARGDTLENEADQAGAAAQNQQEFAISGRVPSQNGRQQKDGGSEAHHAAKPEARLPDAKSAHAEPAKISHQSRHAPLTEDASEEAAAEKKGKEISDKDATLQLRNLWAALPIQIPSATWLTIPFEASHTLDLPPWAPTVETRKPASEAEQNKSAHEAVDSYTAFHREADSAHAKVVTKSNDVRRDIVSQGRNTLRHVDQVLEGALAGAVFALATDRSMIDSGALTALQALDQGEALARIQLGNASLGAETRIADVAKKTDDRITKIKDKLVERFLGLYVGNAETIRTIGKDAADHLSSSELHSSIQQRIQEGAKSDPVDAAEAEAESASVPRYLVEIADRISFSYTHQAASLRGRMEAPSAKGHSLGESLTAFAELVRQATIGDEAQGTPKSLKSQSSDLVHQAHSQAIHTLRSQVAAARKAIEAARLSAREQCSAQRTAVFAQLTNVRQAHVANIQHATANASKTVEEGARSTLTLYPETCRSVAQSLRDAAQKGPGELAQMTRSAVPAALNSLEAAQPVQIKRLEQVGEDARAALTQQGAQAGDASTSVKDNFSSTIKALTLASTTKMSDAAAHQVQGSKGLSTGIAAAAAQFTQRLESYFTKSVSKSREPFDKFLVTETASTIAATFTECNKFTDYTDNPEAAIHDRLENVAHTIHENLEERASKAHGAWGYIHLDADALMASLFGMTAKQGKAVESMFISQFGGGQYGLDLPASLQLEHDRPVGGLNSDEYNACINYLDGNTTKGALYELKTAKGWFSSDSAKAERIMRSLTPAERQDAVISPEWKEVATEVRGGLSGDKLDVFNALVQGNAARADAIELRENVKKAKENNDMNALFKAQERYHPGGETDFLTTLRSDIGVNQQAAQARQDGSSEAPAARQPAIGKTDKPVEFADVKREFAAIQGVSRPTPGDPANKTKPENALRDYVLASVDVEVSDGDGGFTTVTRTVEGPDAVLAEALATEGPGTIKAKAARLYRETETPGTKPSEELENAVLDPRLNPSLPQGRNLSKDEREEAEREHNQIFIEYAGLLREHGAIGQEVLDPQGARKIAAEHLVSHFDVSEEKGLAGAQYASSLVLKDVPDAAAAFRYAQLGWGTDKDLIRRTSQRMSRADINAARDTYKSRYQSDLVEDLGLYGKGTFGELSGDDRLQAERDFMGVPQTQSEASEVALFINLQQKNETGTIGKLLVGAGEAAALDRNEEQLRRMSGITEKDVDDLGRPKVPEGSKNFDKDGKFIAGDPREFDRELTMARITSENYEASIDRVTTAVTTAVAIAGAVVATVATAGAAGPLVAALIAGGTGLVSMGASYAIKGGRYGYEQALTDLGTTFVQAVTAGIGAKLTALAEAANAVTEATEAVEVAEGAAATAAKTAQKGLTLGQTAKIGAVTGGMGAAGNTALDERTWKDGIGAGLDKVAFGSLRGAAGGAVGGAVSHSLGEISLLQGVIGRGVISSAAGVATGGSELLLDEGTGQYQGTMEDAIASLEEAAEQPLLQGILEGAAHHATAATPWAQRRQAAARLQREGGGKQLQEPPSASTPLHDEELRTPSQADHQPPPVPTAVEEPAEVPAHSTIDKLPSTPRLPEGESLSLPRQPLAHASREAGADAGVTAVSAIGELPATPRFLDDEGLSLPRRPLAPVGSEAGEGGIHPPSVTPSPSSGGELLFPDLADAEIYPPRKAPQTETGEPQKPRLFDKAAAGIEGSRFTGDAAEKFGLPRAESPDEAVRKLIDNGVMRRHAEYSRNADGGISHVELDTKAVENSSSKPLPLKVKVRFEMVDTLPSENGVMPVAKFEQVGNKDEYLVLISKGAPVAALERGLAHELTEIRALHGASDVPEEHALTADSKATKLTPHDEGRLAEMAVLAEQLSKAEGVDRTVLLDEAQKLAEHLGLTGKGEAADARRALAFEHIDATGTKKWLGIAIDISENNPYKQKLTRESAADLDTLSKRVALAMKMGDLPGHTNLSTTNHPLVLDAIELIARSLLNESVVVFKKNAGVQAGSIALVDEKNPRRLSGLTKADEIRENLGPKDGIERILFDRAVDRAREPGARKLATGASKGFEAQLSEVAAPGLKLPESLDLALGKSPSRIVSVDAATNERMDLLAKAALLREETGKATEAGDVATAKSLNDQRNALIKSANDISESFGMAAGLAFIRETFPGAEKVFAMTGPGVFDLVVKLKNGEYVIVECKGGKSTLESRWNYEGDKRVDQGTREYAVAVASDLSKSGNQSSEAAEMKKIGQELFTKLRSDPNYRPKYYVVQQPFDAAGQPTSPVVKEADMKPNTPSTNDRTSGKEKPQEPK